jgi:predicted nucleotidyltransferase
MAEVASNLAAIIERYRNELGKMGIRYCERVLVFGSHATGIAHEGSDMDLFVISSDWAPFTQRERLEKLGIAAARILEPIQALGVTPEEIATHQLLPFWEQVLREQAVSIG